GSLPTSLREIRRLWTYSAVSSTPFASTGPVSCCQRITSSSRSRASSGGRSAAPSSGSTRRRKPRAGRSCEGARATAASTEERVDVGRGRLQVADVGAVDGQGGGDVGERQAQLLGG